MAEEAWLFLVSADPADSEVVTRAAQLCNWRVIQAQSCAEFRVCLEKHHPAVIIAASQLPDGDWQQILWSAWDVVETPAMILLADDLSAKARYRASVLDIAWILKRPVDESSVIRCVVQAWWRWNSEYAA